MSGVLYAATLATALGCGLVAGVFFAFSTFVMEGLAQRPAAEGITAMQSINRTVINPAFIGALLGTAVASAGLAVYAMTDWDRSYAAYLVGGAALYIVGTILVTMQANVPRNQALARLDPEAAHAADHWQRYVAQWTAWNHVRTVAALAATAMFAVALASG